jgi:precorrin-2/cobalt-factor-2 C20-methyltransferase
MTHCGTFYGMGVGPGERGLIPVVAWEVLLTCDVIFVPRATSKEASTARSCLPINEIPEAKFREVEFDMSKDHLALEARYTLLAAEIAAVLRDGKSVAYLTLGDSMTYSTFNYALRAVRLACPEAPWRVFPGVTSFVALAAATGQSLGEGKERIQILPCPEDAETLESVVLRNHIVVLMKVGHRLPMVVELLKKKRLMEFCTFGARVGMPEQILITDASELSANLERGYLSTMLIRNPSPQI